jgi:hypothetical protein
MADSHSADENVTAEKEPLAEISAPTDIATVAFPQFHGPGRDLLEQPRGTSLEIIFGGKTVFRGRVIHGSAHEPLDFFARDLLMIKLEAECPALQS